MDHWSILNFLCFAAGIALHGDSDGVQGTVLPSSGSESSIAAVGAGSDNSHFNQTSEKLSHMIGNQTDTAECSPLASLKRATWVVRDADTLWALNHTAITATVRYTGLSELMSACQVQGFTGTTNSFGEITLFLPKILGLELQITFAVAGHLPITLQSVQLDGNLGVFHTFMEPLLFIPKRFDGPGTETGRLRDFSDYTALEDVKLEFRKDMNSHTGDVVYNTTTAADGTWGVSLPAGHYTMTASKSGYITVPYTVVLVGGKSKQYGDTGMSPTLEDGSIRIVSLKRFDIFELCLDIHVRGPIEGSSERAHTTARGDPVPNSLVEYEVNNWYIESVLIQKQLPGVYRISVSDWQKITGARSGGDQWDMANSRGALQFYKGNKLWAQYFLPNRVGNAWSVVDIDGTHMETINKMTTVTNTDDVN